MPAAELKSELLHVQVCQYILHINSIPRFCYALAMKWPQGFSNALVRLSVSGAVCLSEKPVVRHVCLMGTFLVFTYF